MILYKTSKSQFNCDDSNHVDKMPFFTTSLILMTNIWALRTVDKSTLRDFIQKTDQLKKLMILLLCCVTLFKYKPEAVLSREKKRNNQSKQNLGKYRRSRIRTSWIHLDKLNELNKLQAGSAISMLKNQVMKNQSLPRSTSLIDSSISSSTNGGNSVRSWKQVRTRGLSNTTSFATPEDGASTRPSLRVVSF